MPPAASYALRESVEAGGLMSYATQLPRRPAAGRHYTGRILNRRNRPADLPVIRPTKFES